MSKSVLINTLKTMLVPLKCIIDKKAEAPNWNENDPTSASYIKNRPFYTDDSDKTVIIPKQRITMEMSAETASASTAFTVIELSPLIPLIENQAYEVTWDGKKYICIGKLFEEFISIGDERILFEGTGDTPFFIIVDKNVFNGAYICSYLGEHTVEVLQNSKVVKIDNKYLPSMDYVSYNDYQDLTDEQMEIARDNIGAGDGDYNSLRNKPNAVLYTSQSPTTSQKTQARTNIGAVGYESQSLTTAQQTQARTNIGAGDGNYNNLTNKPTIYTNVVRYDVSQTLTEEQKETARNNIGAGKVDPTLTISGLAADAKATGDAIIDIQTTLNAIKDGVTFHDQVTGHNYVLCVRDGNIVTYSAIKNLEITTMPIQTEYTAGEYFIPEGLTISAVAFDGTVKEITGWTYDTNPLEESDFTTVSYTEAGILYTINLPITVNPFNPETMLVDFSYTDNGNGTYTLTGWNQTLNGASSTELVVPNNAKIIL